MKGAGLYLESEKKDKEDGMGGCWLREKNHWWRDSLWLGRAGKMETS